MNYLLVNAIPVRRGRTPAHVALPAAWADDLLALARAVTECGGALTLAAPLLAASGEASHDGRAAIEVVPDAHGFELAPLPHYKSAASYVRARSAVRARLEAAAARADVVQCDYAGHPVPLGAHAWDAAVGKVRVLALNGFDIERHLRGHAESATNPLRRAARRGVQRASAGFVREATRTADLVFVDDAQNHARCAALGAPERCTHVERLPLRDAQLASAADFERLQRAHAAAQPLVVAVHADGNPAGLTQAMTACAKSQRLGAPVQLAILADGTGPAALAAARDASGLRPDSFALVADVPAEAVALVSTSFAAGAEARVLAALAAGRLVVRFETRDALSACPAVSDVRRGNADVLADVLLRLAADRAAHADRAARGLAWTKARTLDAAARARARLALGALERRPVQRAAA